MWCYEGKNVLVGRKIKRFKSFSAQGNGQGIRRLWTDWEISKKERHRNIKAEAVCSAKRHKYWRTLVWVRKAQVEAQLNIESSATLERGLRRKNWHFVKKN